MNNIKKLEIQNNLLIVIDEEYPTALIPLDDVVKLATIYDETKNAYLIELYFYHEQKVDGFACFPTIMFNGKMLHVLTQNYHESYCQDIQLIQDIEHNSFICVSDKRELIYINFEYLDSINNVGYELSSPKDSSIVCNIDLFSLFITHNIETRVNDIPFIVQKLDTIKNKSKKTTEVFEFLVEYLDNGKNSYKEF
jgi:hypothetical protein